MRLYLVTAFLLGFAVPGQPPATPSPTDAKPLDVDRAIAAVEGRLESALAQRDRPALERLIATPFTWVHASDGRVDSRETWLTNAAQGMALSGQRSERSEHGAMLTAYGGAENPQTVVRVARVRLRDPKGTRESWIRQTRLFVRGADGSWQLASGQGTLMYEGPVLDPALHARYAGVYVISPGRTLTLTWENEALLASFPSGATTQIFLASPTEEAARTVGAGRLRFTLGPDRLPGAVALVRGDEEVWRATRKGAD